MPELVALRVHVFLIALSRGAIDNHTLNCAFRMLELRRRQRE